MNYHLIKQYDQMTALYKVDPPMNFFVSQDIGSDPVSSESSLVVAHTASMPHGGLRTLLHCAKPLQGEGVTSTNPSVGYGSMGSMIMDGVKSHSQAFDIHGYHVG